MSILLPFDVAERRSLADGNLHALARALRTELVPLMNGLLPIPDQKARLTRVGGRCAFDGTYLEFDPYSPHEHSCGQCHRVYMNRAHDDWWAMGAQLWIAERAAQAAALNLVTDDPACGTLAIRILRELSDRYLSWPNTDNALGPTRPFFSTYLESIWLLNLCHAIALLEQAGVSAGDAAMLAGVRANLVQPSRDLIAEFHEGRSNRQVWNEVAVLSASHILGDTATVSARLDGRHGLHDLFSYGLLDDGTWYEGENYHLFAHRGLWYGVQLLRALGRPLDAKLEARYRAGFVTPFLAVLPDDTLPARRDSQYKVSIRQWRFAEWCELGIAHARSLPHTAVDERLTGTLHRLYHADPALRLESQHRHKFSTGDAERNEPAGLLSRADLSWRALLMAAPVMQEGRSWFPGSVCLPAQGLAVIRRERGSIYVALEGGHTGGGHGHPDRLSLTVQHNHARWLEDPGTGSYVDPSLHWYRSTLAHAAPIVDGASQDAVPAQLLAFDDRGWAGWICKRIENVKPGVHMQRTIVTFDDHLIDVLEWDADRTVTIDLPIARNVDSISGHHWVDADANGAGGLEDGFDFLSNVQRCADVEVGRDLAGDVDGDIDADTNPLSGQRSSASRTPITIVHTGARPCTAAYNSNVAFTSWRANAPGSPGADSSQIHWMRAVAQRGWIAGIWSWSTAERSIDIEPNDDFPAFTARSGQTQSVHKRTPQGWNILLSAGQATSSIDLVYLPAVRAGVPRGREAESDRDSHGTAIARTPVVIPRTPNALHTELAEVHYLRTEQSWIDAGRPSAVAAFSVIGDDLVIMVTAQTGEIVVPASGADNPLDNERADVNGDGVELFIGPMRGMPWALSWLAVPANPHASTGNVRDGKTDARVSVTTANGSTLNATWNAITHEGVTSGWEMRLQLALSDIPFQSDGSFVMELIVNERPVDRVRRRGMLVLSGGGGFGFLRGDRADSADALSFTLAEH